MSGHIFYKHRWFGFDDAIYTSARILEILSRTDKKLSELLSDVPPAYNTPELRIPSSDEKKFEIVEKIKKYFELQKAFDKLTDKITDYRNELLSVNNALSTTTGYMSAQKRLESTIQGLYSKDTSVVSAALDALPGVIGNFLDASKAVSALPQQYSADYAKAMSALNTASAISRKWSKEMVWQAGIQMVRGDYQNNPAYRDLYRQYVSMQRSGYAMRSILTPWKGDDYWRRRMAAFSAQGGGTVTGPDSGYSVPVTFHGTEHIVPAGQMKEVKQELSDIKEVLVCIMNTNGDQNKTSKKLYRILDRASQGNEYLMTKAVLCE